MRQILAATDPVLVGFATAVLREAGIEPFLMDQYMSGAEGSIGVFPRRIMVAVDDEPLARRALIEAGLEYELSLPPGPGGP